MKFNKHLNLYNFFFDKRGPDLIIIGAQKSGTSTLFNALKNNSSFNSSFNKELHFFDYNYDKGIAWYINNFPATLSNKINFEASPSYLYYPFIPKRIFEYDKQIKLIAVLRDPVERAFSAWNMYRVLYNKKYNFRNLTISNAWDELFMKYKGFPSFKKYIDFEMQLIEKKSNVLEPSIIRRGEYSKQIKRYLSYFDIKNLLVIDNYDLKTQKKEIIKIINDFSGVKNAQTNFEKKNYNQGKYKTELNQTDNERLKDYYRSFNLEFEKLLNTQFSWF